MIFSLFGRGVYSKGAFIRGGVYFKIRDFRGRSLEGAFIRGVSFIRGNTVIRNTCSIVFDLKRNVG